MTPADWRRAIDEAATLGVTMIQFIGGEPTLHPDFPGLVRHAIRKGLSVEVFTNMVHLSDDLWSVFSLAGVQLATSYYADQADQHDLITRRRSSHTRTMGNIVEAVRRHIPIRVGLIDIADGQRVDQARAQLATLGVTEISTDRLRQVGRGVRDRHPGPAQLCGGCAIGKAAITSSGDVWPCVFARWAPIGNVCRTPLADIVTPAALATARQQLGIDTPVGACNPKSQKCAPETQCHPANNPCQPHCPPSYHTHPKRCWPYYYQEKR